MILTDSAWMLWDMSLCQLEWLIIFLARTNVYVMLLYGPARTSFYFGCATMDVLCFCIMFCRSLFIILSFPLVIVLSVLVRYTASDDLFDIFILLMTSLISSNIYSGLISAAQMFYGFVCNKMDAIYFLRYRKNVLYFLVEPWQMLCVFVVAVWILCSFTKPRISV